MKNEIIANIGNPKVLEKMYRDDRKIFRSEFELAYPEIENTETAKFWRARLDYDNKPDSLKTITLSEIVRVILLCLITAFLIKIPGFLQTGISENIFYMKYGAIIVFSGLALYTTLTNRNNELKSIIITSLAFLVPVTYVNILPPVESSGAINLVYIHLPLLMWFIYGMVFTGFDFRDLEKRIYFIRHNGDLVIIYALIAIAGGILTAVTIGLFNSIGLNIENLYAEYIVVSGAVAAPVVASYLIEKIPSLVSRIAPLIAGIFSPLVLVTLVIFLITIVITGKDPYNDRDFLLVFNIMLLGVMGIIIFSVSETSVKKNQRFNAIILLILSIVTIIIDLIALSAIFYRLGEYGLSPNRLAVLVSNILVLANLILIMTGFVGIVFRNKVFSIVEKTVSKFLPVYLLWIIIVVFTFPLIFGIE